MPSSLFFFFFIGTAYLAELHNVCTNLQLSMKLFLHYRRPTSNKAAHTIEKEVLPLLYAFNIPALLEDKKTPLVQGVSELPQLGSATSHETLLPAPRFPAK